MRQFQIRNAELVSKPASTGTTEDNSPAKGMGRGELSVEP